MTLTKDDLEAIWHCIWNTWSNNGTKEQHWVDLKHAIDNFKQDEILKNQEDADILRRMQKDNMQIDLGHYDNHKLIVEELKKRMEECKGNTNEMRVGTSDYIYQTRLATELQKILGKKNEEADIGNFP